MSEGAVLASGHTPVMVEGEEWERLQEHFPSYKDGLVRLNPGGWLLPHRFLEFADQLYNFEVCASDVIVMTWPKCGTTWTQEIVWTMRNNPNLTHPSADDPIFDRSPFLEGDMFTPPAPVPAPPVSGIPVSDTFKRLCPASDPSKGTMLPLAEAIPHPRTLKTHLPLSLLTPSLLDTCKVVYVARNPKDSCLSYLHHHRLFRAQNFNGDQQEFVDHFVADELVYAPYSEHLKEVWEVRHHPNLHLVFYEDLKYDIMKELQKLDQFLGTNLTQDELHNVARHTSFDVMQKNTVFFTQKMMENDAIISQNHYKSDGGFFRQGKSGDWKNKMSPGQVEQVDRWTNEQCDFGITFK